MGEGGYKLSQGERQRLSIARDLERPAPWSCSTKPPARSTPPATALIQAALANLLRGRTALCIAHRLSTIVDADLIVVMDGGLIVQKGTHAQLLADPSGLYRQLCARQFGEAGRASEAQRRPEPVHVKHKHPPRLATSKA